MPLFAASSFKENQVGVFELPDAPEAKAFVSCPTANPLVPSYRVQTSVSRLPGTVIRSHIAINSVSREASSPNLTKPRPPGRIVYSAKLCSPPPYPPSPKAAVRTLRQVSFPSLREV